MPSDDEYESMIDEYRDWSQLADLWEKIKKRDTPGWGEGKAFEYLVLQAFKLAGGAVHWPYSVELENEIVEQIDGFVHVAGLSCMVETKHTVQKQAVGPIAKMRNQLLRRHSNTIGLVVSFSGFTEAAVILAKHIAPQAILLWSGFEVEEAIRDRRIVEALEYKYRRCLEYGLPDLSINRPVPRTGSGTRLARKEKDAS
jgi:hypothetical protein